MTVDRKALFYVWDPEGTTPSLWCSGPGADGVCPAAVEGQPVPCAGYDLVLACPDQNPLWRRTIGAHETECPLPIILAGGG